MTAPPFNEPDALYNQEALLERIATLEAERDKAREDCGYEKRMRESAQNGLDRWVNVAQNARATLVATGYFTEDQVMAHELAPRIIELWSAFGPCFCGDVALKNANPIALNGVEHTTEGCHYGPSQKETSPPP